MLFDVQIIWVLILFFYVAFVTYSTKKTYEFMINRGLDRNQAVYYNRKLVHIFAGGVVVLLVPILFRSPWYPLLAGLLITGFTLFSHRSNHLLYWFQTEKNLNDVSFCFMWGITIFVLWYFMGDPWIAVIPPAFMAIGDGVTGIIRSFVFAERTKHFIGNIWMAAFCIPLGFYLAYLSNQGLIFWGVMAALAASLMERFEIGPLDDNVLIAISSTIVLYLGYLVGPVF
ncbi:MAG: hypothetical protein V5A64_06995 [Candidatus Thermoplasmatota archaeon]